jgi:hypothetical protein
MATITFTATFSGGNGTLAVDIDDTIKLNFTDAGPLLQTADISIGLHDFVVSGAASPGPGGGVQLVITGDADSNSPLNYGAGVILPDPQQMVVNS